MSYFDTHLQRKCFFHGLCFSLFSLHPATFHEKSRTIMQGILFFQVPRCCRQGNARCLNRQILVRAFPAMHLFSFYAPTQRHFSKSRAELRQMKYIRFMIICKTSLEGLLVFHLLDGDTSKHTCSRILLYAYHIALSHHTICPCVGIVFVRRSIYNLLF